MPTGWIGVCVVYVEVGVGSSCSVGVHGLRWVALSWVGMGLGVQVNVMENEMRSRSNLKICQVSGVFPSLTFPNSFDIFQFQISTYC